MQHNKPASGFFVAREKVDYSRWMCSPSQIPDTDERQHIGGKKWRIPIKCLSFVFCYTATFPALLQFLAFGL